MKKTVSILMATAFIATSAVPARASDELLKLGIGLGAAIIGEAVKGAKNRPKATPRKQSSKQSSSRSSGSSKARAAPAPKRQADPQVQEAQQLLSDLGYTVGKVDGFAGNNTTKAILAFKKDNGIGGDGAKIDAEFIAALKAIKANPAPTAIATAATATAGAATVAATDTKAEPAQAPVEEVAEAPAEPETTQEDYLAAVAAEGPISSQEPISEEIAEAVAAIQAPQPAAEAPTVPEAKPEAEVAKVEEQKPAPEAVEPTPSPVVEAEGFTISDDF